MKLLLRSTPVSATVWILCLALRSPASDSEPRPDFKAAILESAAEWGGNPQLDIRGEIPGPDGRIYWLTGNAGYSFTTKEGRHYDRPGEAGVFRCDPDGSNAVEFFRGLRAPKQLAFDALGNLFVFDRQTEWEDSVRIFYLLEGGDAGWRGEWMDTALALPSIGKISANRFPRGSEGNIDLPSLEPEGAGYRSAWRQLETLPASSDSGSPDRGSPDRSREIWEIARQAREDESRLALLIELLGDADAEIRAQAARVLADSGFDLAGRALAAALKDESPRVRAFAAIGVGKCRIPQTFERLLEVLAENDNRDPFLRHACVQGLWFLNEREQMLKQVDHDSAAVRLGVLLTLRKLGDPRVKYFLDDPDPGIRLEAEQAVSAQNSAAGPDTARA